MKLHWKLLLCMFGRHEKAKGDWKKACSGTKLIRMCPRCTTIIEERSMLEAETRQHIADMLKESVDKTVEHVVIHGRRPMPYTYRDR